MNFQEEFPSMIEAVSRDALMVSLQVVKVFCLDKQRVKELLDNYNCRENKDVMICINTIKLRLGL